MCTCWSFKSGVARAFGISVAIHRIAGAWDSLHFTNLTNEIISYSLMSFDAGRQEFSMHPLVHEWSWDTLSDPKLYHHTMMTVIGMSIAPLTEEKLRLESQYLLPHIDFLREGINQECLCF
jgi:hypothetical protein